MDSIPPGLVVYFRATWRTFQPKLEKIKKIHPERNSLYFRRWNFLALVLKKFRKQKPRKKFLLFQETETLEKFFIFRETEPFSSPPKKFLYFRKRKPLKNLYTSGNRTFLYFRKRNFLMFRETYIQNPSIFRTLIYLELEAHSDPWYIQNSRHIQNTFKHLRWHVLQK